MKKLAIKSQYQYFSDVYSKYLWKQILSQKLRGAYYTQELSNIFLFDFVHHHI